MRLNRGSSDAAANVTGGGGGYNSTPSSGGDGGSGSASRSTTPRGATAAGLTSPRNAGRNNAAGHEESPGRRAAFDDLQPFDPLLTTMSSETLSAAVLHDLGALGAAPAGAPTGARAADHPK